MTDEQRRLILGHLTTQQRYVFAVFCAASHCREVASRRGNYFDVVAAQIDYDGALYDLTAAGLALWEFTGKHPLMTFADYRLIPTTIGEDCIWTT